MHMFIGTIPGSFGETSTLAILIGALIFILTGIGSWKVIVSVFAGGLLMGLIMNIFGTSAYMQASFLLSVCYGWICIWSCIYGN